jgi:hypothetical protein
MDKGTGFKLGLEGDQCSGWKTAFLASQEFSYAETVSQARKRLGVGDLLVFEVLY